MVIEEGPYTLTSVDNYDGDSFADFTSTLKVAVDDIANRTNISCVILGNQTHLVIYKISELLKRNIFVCVTLCMIFCWSTSSSSSSSLCDGEDGEFPT